MKTDGSRNIFAKFVSLALVSAFALGACGIKGELQTPPPLWGDKTADAEKKPETEKPESNN